MAFDGMQGTYVKRDASGLYFMSKKGIWKPMRFPAHIDVAALIPGNKYGIELNGRELNALHDLGPNPFFEKNLAEHGGGAPMQSQAPTAPSPAPQAPTPMQQAVPANGLMASATGVVKSLLESQPEMAADDAFKHALKWAEMWGDLPTRANHFLNKDANAQKVAAAVKAAGLDPNDDVPF
jgi:hypothetical protein